MWFQRRIHAHRSNVSKMSTRKKIFFIFTLLLLVIISVVPIILILFHVSEKTHQLETEGTITSPSAGVISLSKECQLRTQFNKGNFVILSHRSFIAHSKQFSDAVALATAKVTAKHTDTEEEDKEPTCGDALKQLKKAGVNHLYVSIELKDVTDGHNHRQEIVVSHPMEFTQQSTSYSLCNDIPLRSFIGLLDKTYAKSKWFMSIEPHGSWGKTYGESDKPQLSSLAKPTDVMRGLLDEVFGSDNLGKYNCGLVIDTTALYGMEEIITLRTIYGHCKLLVFSYDFRMPTVRFYPDHKEYQYGSNGIVFPSYLKKHSIFWEVNDSEELKLAAALEPYGIVSNSPENMIKTITGDPNWCPLPEQKGG